MMIYEQHKKKRNKRYLPHVGINRLFVRGVSGHMKVSGHFVDAERGLHATSFAVVYVGFHRVFDETNFVSAQIVLYVESKDFIK